jgi:hypothetical protein
VLLLPLRRRLRQAGVPQLTMAFVVLQDTRGRAGRGSKLVVVWKTGCCVDPALQVEMVRGLAAALLSTLLRLHGLL